MAVALSLSQRVALQAVLVRALLAATVPEVAAHPPHRWLRRRCPGRPQQAIAELLLLAQIALATRSPQRVELKVEERRCAQQ